MDAEDILHRNKHLRMAYSKSCSRGTRLRQLFVGFGYLSMTIILCVIVTSGLKILLKNL